MADLSCLLTTLPAASIVLVALAIIGAIIRVAIRLHYQRRLYVDDGFLFFAIICLCVATGLMYEVIPSMYLVEAILTNDPNISLPSNFIAEPLLFHKLSDGFLVLTYNTIFAVKFSFLFFFRVLIRRVHSMLVYWWMVAVLTAVVWAYGVIGVFLTCPYFDIRSCAYQLPLLP